MDIALTSEVLAAMQAAARGAHPHEACGILLGTQTSRGWRIIEARAAANIHPDPATFFEIDPQALINAHRAARSGGPQVLGYYHSHPAGPPAPSATDQANAPRDGRIWAILGSAASGYDGIGFWRDGKDGFAPLSFGLFES